MAFNMRGRIIWQKDEGLSRFVTFSDFLKRPRPGKVFVTGTSRDPRDCSALLGRKFLHKKHRLTLVWQLKSLPELFSRFLSTFSNKSAPIWTIHSVLTWGLMARNIKVLCFRDNSFIVPWVNWESNQALLPQISQIRFHVTSSYSSRAAQGVHVS